MAVALTLQEWLMSSDFAVKNLCRSFMTLFVFVSLAYSMAGRDVFVGVAGVTLIAWHSFVADKELTLTSFLWGLLADNFRSKGV